MDGFGWELRACILLSLFLQIFLAVAGTFRRLASQRRIVKIIWLAYLLAEFVAVFGLGLIVSKQSLLYYSAADSLLGAPIGSSDSKDDRFEVRCLRSNVVVPCGDGHILMYCAAFLLIHLGGPDSITAFAMEDNELWLRNLFYLASKCIAVAYAIYQSVQTIHEVQIPVLLLFLYGIIKCTERTCALYYGSAKSFRNSMLSKSNSGFNIIPIIDKSLIEMNVKDFEHVEVLQNAFLLFTVFKGLVVDLSVSILERNKSRDLFLARSSADAFRLVEVELNYLYDVLFTKIPLLHSKLGLCCRSLSFIAVVSSLVLFNSSSEGYHHTKEMFPYILFSGAIFLEVIAFYMLLFSDWTVVKLEPLSEAFPHRNLWKDKFLKCILFVNRTRNDFYHFFLRHVGVNHHIGSEFSDGRWADSFSTFNLTCYCLHRCSKGREKIYTSLRLLLLLNGFVYVQSQPLSQFIASFIFDELKMKSEIAETVVVAKQICSSKGEWMLKKELKEDTFGPYVENHDFDDILLMWHIATELCFNDSEDPEADKDQRDTAKQLSGYMLYLLVMKPDMMSAVSSIGETKFLNACNAISEVFDKELGGTKKQKFCQFFRGESKGEKEAVQREAKTFLSVKREVHPGGVQMDTDIFFHAFMLAKELKLLPSKEKWLLISKLWVELLSYAATHIRSSAHAEQLSKGGELITVVWFLMAHFGLGELYEINQGKTGS